MFRAPRQPIQNTAADVDVKTVVLSILISISAVTPASAGDCRSIQAMLLDAGQGFPNFQGNLTDYGISGFEDCTLKNFDGAFSLLERLECDALDEHADNSFNHFFAHLNSCTQYAASIGPGWRTENPAVENRRTARWKIEEIEGADAIKVHLKFRPGARPKSSISISRYVQETRSQGF
jgi:hypothetical protein